MDDEAREIRNGALFIRDGVLEFVGATVELSQILIQQANETLSLPNHIILPGLINTHHHMYQSLTRVIAQQNELFDWLVTLYPIWANLTGEMAYTSAKLAMAELILSGCTSSSDHLYIYPNDVKLEDTIRAAQEIGMRFHPTRGSMSVGESKGGLPPDSVVEDEDDILRITRDLIENHHNPNRYSMLRIGVAPCSPFSVSQDLMRESATLARSYHVRLHTHLAENVKDIDYSNEVFGMRPGDYAEDVGWIGDDVWHAHCVQLNDDEISLFGRTGTGICHCPGSNMRLASGIASIRKMLDHKVRVGLGVDGSASNDGAHLLNEARMAMLLQRVGGDPSALSAREALSIATRGGAAVLGRDDIGRLAVNTAADFIGFRVDDPAFAGAQQDLAAALIFCQSLHVDLSVINGQFVVKDGNLLTVDLSMLVEKHNQFSHQLINSV
jgi:cytosine/adenosine deaminase-related metal-dependent hydrolase